MYSGAASDDNDSSKCASPIRPPPALSSTDPHHLLIPQFSSARDRRRRRKLQAHTKPRVDDDLEKFSAQIHMVCCVFSPTSHSWRTTPLTFDRLKSNDQELWWEIRAAYRDRLQGVWRRVFGFKKLAHIVPIEYTHNGVPIRSHPDSYPNRHTFLHAFHHPSATRPDRVWIDWLIQFRSNGDPGKTYGLEFVESLWIEKFALVSIGLGVGICLACVLWVHWGGNVQTVFTVMDFVETGIAGAIGFVALYYQAVLAA